MSANWRSYWVPSPRRSLRAARLIWALLLLSILTVGLATRPLLAASPPSVQVFFVPVPEDQGFTALKSIFPSNALCGTVGQPEVVEPVITYNSISVLAPGTIIYYDHWEDGYEIDLSNPTQATTEIWGDGDPSNGAPPGIPSDILDANTVILLNESVNLATRQSVIDYDGGDRFGATRTVAFTRALWASGSRTFLAGAIEVYPVDRWGTEFRTPVGIDTPSPDLFTYTALVVMAGEDGTLVDLDLDADGVFETQVTLNMGESHLTPGTVLEGASVQASAPVQVALITGDLCDNYESRWFVLFPETQWSDRYYSPVSTIDSDLTVAYLYNPHSTALTVTRETMGGGVLATVLQPNSSAAVPVPSDSGARFASSDERPFLGIAAIDAAGTGNSSADWGFTLVPEDQLTTQTLIGWGGGRDPESLVNPNENGSPVWVIPVFGEGNGPTVNICVDFQGDNLGPLEDVNGFRYDLLLTLEEFESAKVFDPSGDQTGMLLYICPEAIGEPVSARLAAAWGQDPSVASPGQPGLDLGTTAPPAATFEAGKSADLEIDLDGDGLADGGDRIRYTVIIRNSSRVPIPGVTISDTIPLYTTYVPDTTTVDLGSGPESVADDDGVTPFPLDEGGIALGTLPTGGVFTVTFAVDIDEALPIGIDRIRNVAVVRAGGEEARPFVETPLDRAPAIAIRKLTNGVDANEAPGVLVRAGATVTWTYVVTNTGPVSLTALSVTDDQPGVTPVLVDGDEVPPSLFAPGETRTYAATGIAVAGQYSNTGTAVGVSVDSAVVTATDVSHAFGVVSGITITKQASAELVRGGDPVTYTFAVSNTGNMPLTDVSVRDNRCAPVQHVLAGEFNIGDANNDDALDLGEVWLFTCTTVVTEPVTVNVGVVTAVDVLGEPVTASATATVLAVTSAIDLTKIASRDVVTAGTTVVFTVTATNIGQDPLTDVEVTDNRCDLTYVGGDGGETGVMEVGETWIFTCSAVITQTTVNVATVVAIDSFGDEVSDSASAQVIVPILYLPWLWAQVPEVPCPPPDGCPIGAEIKALAVHSAKEIVYVVTRNPDRLLALDQRTLDVLAEAETGSRPWDVVVNESTNRVYVSAYDGGDVRVFDAATLALQQTIPVGVNPALMAILPDLDTVFVLVRGGSRVAVIQGATLVQDLSSGGSGPLGIAADPVNQRVFISHRDSASMSMLRRVGADWQAFAGPVFGDGRQLFGLAYGPSTQRLFALYAAANEAWFLDVWEPNDNTAWGRFGTRGMPSSGALASPDVGGIGIAFNPTTGRLFVANTGANSLSVIDGVSLGVTRTVVLGQDPFAVAVDGVTQRVFVGLRAPGRLIKLADVD